MIDWSAAEDLLSVMAEPTKCSVLGRADTPVRCS